MRLAWHKYRAKRTEVDGISFPSKGEAGRYVELRLQERAGEIRELKLQPRFPLLVGEPPVLVSTFVGDFQYLEKNSSTVIVEDFKGFYTPECKLKHRLFVVLYPKIELRVIDKKGVNHVPKFPRR